MNGEQAASGRVHLCKLASDFDIGVKSREIDSVKDFFEGRVVQIQQSHGELGKDTSFLLFCFFCFRHFSPLGGHAWELGWMKLFEHLTV